MGNRAHSPELVVACVLIVACVLTRILVLTRVLILTCVLVVACVHTWALGIICEPWWPLWLVVVHARRGLWVMVKGARRCGWWWTPVSGFAIMGTRRQSWVMGRSLPSMGWRCGSSSLFVLVVSRGVHVVDGGGRLWAVVEFGVVGGDVVGTRCCLCWCCGGVSGGARIVVGGRLWAVVVVVVTSW